jgi:NAD(P)-dependent dehydrogenase (short-subunit alcohol dehydrogenase family)
MAKRGYGRIVNVTSINGAFGERGGLAYDAAKAGLDQATRTLAIEYGGRGVLCNAVAPGFVETRMSLVDGVLETETEEFAQVYVEGGRLPLGRAAQPEEIGGLVAWLCSSDNTYVTAQVIRIDGGLTATF